jgi:glutamine amidotransferase of anthranilate synthase or aminodeoxychorismate synthase
VVVLIDNYDSFSYNLVQMVGSMQADIKIIRNDAMSVAEIKGMKPSHIILSPGPGYPKDAGVCEAVVRQLQGVIPILGVCLGHQGICEVFGATVAPAKQLMHGKKSNIEINTASAIFKGMESQIEAARYHSLVAKEETIPECLQVIGIEAGGEVMAVQHKKHQIYGVQFHPESILTPKGEQIIWNFLNI